MSWAGGDDADDFSGPTYPLPRPTFPHYRAPFPEWCSVGRPVVAGVSMWRCRNGHPVQVASEFCSTCVAPITVPPAAPDKAWLLAPAATLRDAARPHAPRPMMWTLLAGAVAIAVGIVLVAVVVVSLI